MEELRRFEAKLLKFRGNFQEQNGYKLPQSYPLLKKKHNQEKKLGKEGSKSKDNLVNKFDLSSSISLKKPSFEFHM